MSTPVIARGMIVDREKLIQLITQLELSTTWLSYNVDTTRCAEFSNLERLCHDFKSLIK